MQSYGIARPILLAAYDFIKAGGRFARSLYQQRRLTVGRNVTIAHDVAFFGKGEVLLGDDVTISRGAVFTAAEGSVIEIGSNSEIGASSHLDAGTGQVIRVGRHFKLAARCCIVSKRGIFFGDQCSVGYESSIGPREGDALGVLLVGTNCHLNSHTLIDLCADVVIGDDVRTGPFCAFYTHNHVPAHGKLIWDQPLTFASINVGRGTWIGHKCCILPGVAIGDNCTIATGAVVTRDIQPWTVAGGVPARKLKTILAESSPDSSSNEARRRLPRIERAKESRDR